MAEFQHMVRKLHASEAACKAALRVFGRSVGIFDAVVCVRTMLRPDLSRPAWKGFERRDV